MNWAPWPLNAFMAHYHRADRWPANFAWNLFQALSLHAAYRLGAATYQPNRWGSDHPNGLWKPGCGWHADLELRRQPVVITGAERVP